MRTPTAQCTLSCAQITTAEQLNYIVYTFSNSAGWTAGSEWCLLGRNSCVGHNEHQSYSDHARHCTGTWETCHVNKPCSPVAFTHPCRWAVMRIQPVQVNSKSHITKYGYCHNFQKPYATYSGLLQIYVCRTQNIVRNRRSSHKF